MATETLKITLSTTVYTALSAADNNVSVFINRGDSVRLVVAESLPGPTEAAYIKATGITYNDDGAQYRYDFLGLTASGGCVYAMANDQVTTVVVVLIESS